MPAKPTYEELEKQINLLKATNEELRNTNALFYAIFEGSRDAIFLADQAARFCYVNQAACDLTGHTRDQLLTMHIPDLHAPEDLHAFNQFFEVIMGGEAVISQADILQKDGTKVPVEFSNAAITIGNKKFMHTIARDITQRQQAEKTLKNSHEQFLTVLNSIDATIYVADMDTYEVLFMNQYMIDAFGGNYTGEKCWKVFRKESGPCPFCTNDRLLQPDGTPAGVQTWHDKNPVTGRWFINHDRAVEWVDGRMVRLQIATDITAFKKMEERLNQAQKLESIGSLASGIAHDFNNILFPIVGLSELMLEDLPAHSPMHENIQEVLRAGRRGRDLVGQILTFSRQTGQDLMPVSLQQVLKEVLKLCRSTIPADIAISRNIQPDCGLVMADPTQIHQIAMNLITNAYHAMADDKGTIDVQLRQMTLEKSDSLDVNMEPGPYAVLSVSDNGCGISADMMDKIFDPYFTTKKKGKGTGLGLSVVQGIVRAHKGYITVQSQVNKGSAFIVYLPVVKSPDRPDPPEEKTEISGGKEHILLVDDEKPIVQLETQILERLGYTITAFTDSVDAVNAFQADPDGFDLVITDMAMPHMTGAKLAGEMIAIRSDIPIIMCTGFSDRISEETAKYAGIKHLLMKPVVMSDLACAVRKVLDEANR